MLDGIRLDQATGNHNEKTLNRKGHTERSSITGSPLPRQQTETHASQDERCDGHERTKPARRRSLWLLGRPETENNSIACPRMY